MIVVIDSGTGNLHSVVRAFERIGAAAIVSVSPHQVAKAERIVLPGVGSARAAMATLAEHQLIEPLEQRVRGDCVPFLGICLGLQLLTRTSEEGEVSGLGWIAAATVRLRPTDPLQKVPHLGWSDVNIRRSAPLFAGVPAGACFYFAHSYAVRCDDETSIAAEAEYGMRFAAAVQQGNVFGVQFHPEKSQAHGLQVLRNFVDCC
ncbi:MAG TPA: imidazole glycerol phosphate synthase subunit HisH [Terriglobales bacterium]|nr:imidazole glycerol phosphate synthase subunit HisH [Terriglobales bacterium]